MCKRSSNHTYILHLVYKCYVVRTFDDVSLLEDDTGEGGQSVGPSFCAMIPMIVL